MKVKRVRRSEPSVLVTDDGYRYEWLEPGDAVDVLPHHRRQALAVTGAKLVTVEVIDEPVILPAFPVVEPIPDTLVLPPPLEDEVLNPKSLVIEDPVLPAAEPEEPTVLPPPPVVSVEITPNVTPFWSDADRALLKRTRR